jgi:hypothetical protein
MFYSHTLQYYQSYNGIIYFDILENNSESILFKMYSDGLAVQLSVILGDTLPKASLEIFKQVICLS